MYKIFTGFHLVEAYHKARREQRVHPKRVLKKLIYAAIVLAVTLFL